MEKFIELEKEFEQAKKEADKFYVNENMQAGKRFFASLMDIQRKCKIAREELSEKRIEIRKKRKYGV